MPDCGVCLTCDCDEFAFDIDTDLAVSDGSVKCCECDKYELAVLHFGDEDVEEEEGADEGSARWSSTYETCLICAEIAEAFYCNGRTYGGALWEDMSYVYEELTITCFDKLSTPEAKKELQRRWIEWRENTL